LSEAALRFSLCANLTIPFCLPAWMTDEAASRFEIGGEPRFPLDVLRSLRNEVNALLGFLAAEPSRMIFQRS